MSVTMETTIREEFARINFRLPNEMKVMVERAALLSGLTVTDFAIQTLVGKANEVLDDHQMRKLSDRDRDIFLAMLDEDMEPNEALDSAFDARDRLIAK